MQKRKYGWKPDLMDQRDHLFSVLRIQLPPMIDWREKMPPVYDQGQLGSCTANAIAAAVDYERGKQGESFITPSRLFIYYNERKAEGTVLSDAGAAIRDGIKSVKNLGDCPESEWPYDISKFTKKPSKSCYVDGLKYKAVQYASIARDLQSLKNALNAGPVVFGMTVYESFEGSDVAATGIVPMPAPGETVLGGHAVVAVGYDDSKQAVIVRNSWGEGWGDKGYCYIPYKYFTVKYTSDYWAIQVVL